VIDELIDEVLRIHAEIDREVAAFKLLTGLRCRDGCGRCCPEAPIQVSVVEMLPAAAALVRSGNAQEWFDRLAVGPVTCVGYAPVERPGLAGRCILYTQRPAVCRLFGFAAVRNRRGRLELSTCRPIREDLPAAVTRADARIAEGSIPPLLAGYTGRIFGLDPTARLLPINGALRRALERCALAFEMETGLPPEGLPRAG